MLLENCQHVAETQPSVKIMMESEMNYSDIKQIATSFFIESLMTDQLRLQEFYMSECT